MRMCSGMLGPEKTDTDAMSYLFPNSTGREYGF